ncbi:unnamed protein product [Amoebophrya sp. A25]|nr:unnamed protein product [Amoebophrya sp. A25]|eukprot:GSA25T00007104001.1
MARTRKNTSKAGPLGLPLWLWAVLGASCFIFTGKIITQWDTTPKKGKAGKEVDAAAGKGRDAASKGKSNPEDDIHKELDDFQKEVEKLEARRKERAAKRANSTAATSNSSTSSTTEVSSQNATSLEHQVLEQTTRTTKNNSTLAVKDETASSTSRTVVVEEQVVEDVGLVAPEEENINSTSNSSTFFQKEQEEEREEDDWDREDERDDALEKNLSTELLLKLSLKLYEATGRASSVDYDNAAAIRQVLTELKVLSDAIENVKTPVVRGHFLQEIQNGIAVIRGTVKQKMMDESVLDDAEMAELLEMIAQQESYTYDQPEYWERHYSNANASEWYFSATEKLEPFSMTDAVPWNPRTGIDVTSVLLGPGAKNSTTISPNANSNNSATESGAGDEKDEKVMMTSLIDFFGPKGPLHAEVGGKDAKILILGCGRSELSKLLVTSTENEENGAPFYIPANVLGVDVSTTLIENMRREHPGLRYEVADATDLKTLIPKNGSFDIVFEKGTLDAVEQSPQMYQGIAAEAVRVLGGGNAATKENAAGSKKKFFVSVSLRDTVLESSHDQFGENFKDCKAIIVNRARQGHKEEVRSAGVFLKWCEI